MSEILNQLASLEVSNEMINFADLHEIASNFKNNYEKLDNLKEFRSEYEKKTWFRRLWHRDSLRDVQMDATQVQAEFSKSIGQLMMISILQSKMMSNQQTVLNAQQLGLKAQADNIETNTKDLAAQHEGLKEQSERLENLVRDYFALKGLTEKGAAELIRIATEVKGTKNEMLANFDERVTDLQEIYSQFSHRLDERVAQIDSQVQAAIRRIDSAFDSFKQETLVARQDLASAMHQENEGLRQELGKAVDAHRERVDKRVIQVAVQIKHAIEKVDSEFKSLRQEDEAARQDFASAMHQKNEAIRQELGKVIDSQRETVRGLSCLVDEHVEELSQHTVRIATLGEKMDTQLAKFKRLGRVMGLGIIASITLFAWVFIALRGR